MYGGQDSYMHTFDKLPLDTLHLPTIAKTVMFLLMDLLDLAYKCYCDNYFMSVDLLQYCLEHDTLITGTMRAARIPTVLLNSAVPSTCYHMAQRGLSNSENF